MNINSVCILGGSGFVGRHIVGRLSARGYAVRVPTRSRERAKALCVLPTVEVVEASVSDPAGLAECLRGMDAVINLVGILHETRRGDFHGAHVELPRQVVQACTRLGIRRLLHMSALGADPNGPSAYFRSKGEGEAIVRAAGRELAVTIFRPSVIFGREDSFLNLFAQLIRLPFLPLANPDARFQPVFVEDVAHAYAESLANSATFGQSFELCGPDVYTLRELVEFVAQTLGRRPLILPLNDQLSYLQAWLFEHLPGKKLMTRDNYRSLQVANVCSSEFPRLFGIRPAALETVAPAYLAGAVARSRYTRFRKTAHR